MAITMIYLGFRRH